MKTQAADLGVIKDIPGYKVILKTVLKTQIQQLVEQLAEETGEESILLTASVTDGSLSHLGSESGKDFLDNHDDIKSQFLGFCLTKHHRQEQLEKERDQQNNSYSGGRNTLPAPARSGAGRKPKFVPKNQNSSRRNTTSPRQTGVHPVSLTKVSPRGGLNVRHEPYPINQPRKSSLNRVQQRRNLSSTPKQQSSFYSVPVNSESVHGSDIGPSEVIKIEAIDLESEGDLENTNNFGESDSETKTFDSRTNRKVANTSQAAFEPSSSNITIEPIESNPHDQNTDSVNLTNISANLSINETDTLEQNVSNDYTNLKHEESDLDPNVNIKVEAVTESELDLEIMGVEPGNMTQNDNNWMPTVQSGMDFGASVMAGSSQGDTVGNQINMNENKDTKIEDWEQCAKETQDEELDKSDQSDIELERSLKWDETSSGTSYTYMQRQDGNVPLACRFSSEEMLAKKEKRGKANDAQLFFQSLIRDAATTAEIWKFAPMLSEISSRTMEIFFNTVFSTAPNLLGWKPEVWKRLGECLQNRRKYLKISSGPP